MLKPPNFLQKTIPSAYWQNGAWLFWEYGVRFGIGFWVSIWLANYLGTESYGIYNYIIAWVVLASAFGSLGLDTLIIRELIEKPEKSSETLSAAFVLSGAASVTIYLGIAAWLWWTEIPSVLPLFLCAGLSIIGLPFQVFRHPFSATVQSKKPALLTTFFFFATAIVRIIGLVTHQPLVFFAAVLGLEGLFLGITVWWLYKHHFRVHTWRLPSKDALFRLAAKVGIMLAISICISLQLRIDQLMMKHISGTEAVGVYAIAVTWTGLWSVVPSLIANSFWPVLIQGFQDPKSSKLLETLIPLFALLGWIAMIGYWILSPWFVHTFYASSFEGAIAPMRWLGASFVFGALLTLRYLFLMAQKQEINLLYYLIIGLVVQIIANVVLQPIYGAEGAGMSVMLAQGTMLLPLFWRSSMIHNKLWRALIWPFRPLSTWQSLWQTSMRGTQKDDHEN